MRTQSNVDTDTRTAPMATEPSTETMSFRAPTLDEAVALAEESLGSSVRVVAANRIRRGGIGGFFASDLGVEVSVALDDETIEQALERLVSETAADERTRWMEDRVGIASMPSRSIASQPAAPDPTTAVTSLAAPRRSALASPLATPKTAEGVVRIGPREEEPSLVRVDQIIEELQFLTSRPETDVQQAPPPARSVALPRLPPRSIDIAQAAAANAQAQQERAVADELDRATTALQSPVPQAPVPVLPTPVLPAPAQTVPAQTVPAQTGPTSIEATATLDAPAPTETGTEPSQRQVELAVAATDQLIESLQRDAGVKRLSVRVILRTGDQNAVEAVAEWEAS